MQCGPRSLHYCTLPKKAFLSTSVWARREYIWKLNCKESLLIYSENFQGAPCSHRQSRNRMMNTFIMVNITPICRWESLEDESILLVHFKKTFSLTLFGHSFSRRVYWLLFHYESYQGIPLFLHTGKADERMVNTLPLIRINPTCKRLLILICQEKNRDLACITNKQVINCQKCFFIGVALKLAVSVSWHNSLFQRSVLVLIFWTASELDNTRQC